MQKRQDRPGDLRQQVNRIKASRDNLKDINREKSAINKKLRDRNAELSENRDKWKARSKELEHQLEVSQEETECERTRANQECERADQLQAEIETILKKKSGAVQFNS